MSTHSSLYTLQAILSVNNPSVNTPSMYVISNNWRVFLMDNTVKSEKLS